MKDKSPKELRNKSESFKIPILYFHQETKIYDIFYRAHFSQILASNIDQLFARQVE